MLYEVAGQRCPRCGHCFTVLADEYGTHPCPKCGYEPVPFEEGESEKCCRNCTKWEGSCDSVMGYCDVEDAEVPSNYYCEEFDYI